MSGRRLRESAVIAVFVLASMAASHELIYLLAHGSGADYARAMQESGHDRYWTSFIVTVAGVTTGLAVVAYRQIRRLQIQTSHARRGWLTVDDGGLRLFVGIAARLWFLTTGGTALAFLIQENLETVTAGLPFPGANAVAGENGLALPVIAAVSLFVALVGALARWGRAVLLARLRSAFGGNRRPPRLPRPASFDRPGSLVAVRSNGLRAPPSLRPSFA